MEVVVGWDWEACGEAAARSRPTEQVAAVAVAAEEGETTAVVGTAAEARAGALQAGGGREMAPLVAGLEAVTEAAASAEATPVAV